MPERAEIRTAPNELGVVQIFSTSTTSLRLKSWLPEYTSGIRPVVLAGRELPSQVGATLSGAMRVLCLGPGEWLVVSNGNQASDLHERIEAELPKEGIALLDLTHAVAGLEVRGSAAREVLSKGCGLDVDPRTFAVGTCARTRFAQIPVVIECLDDPPRFQLYVGRSYLDYLRSWLVDAAVEFGVSLT